MTMAMNKAICRRTGLKLLAASVLPGTLFGQSPSSRSAMGLVIYDCNLRQRWLKKSNPSFDLFSPLNFLTHCNQVGAGGMQARLGELTPQEIQQLRSYSEQHDLYIEAIVSPPKSKKETNRFKSEIQTAIEVGALSARTTIMPGRRYEQFKTLAEFKEFEQRGKRMLQIAAPIAERLRFPIAVENHKDQRISERVDLFRALSSEFIGACVDTGNSFALLDGAYEPLEALAPFAFSVHLKDQALQPSKEGFFLGDIPLGQGSFDLKKMVAILRRKKPDIRFSLELITRDPLHVPCLTPQYWATMSQVPADDLNNTLAFVRNNPAKLQYVSEHSNEHQVELENSNVRMSLQYARSELNL